MYADAYEFLGKVENKLNASDHDTYWDGTPSCPVLYHRTAHGTVVGISDETVCLYLDMGEDKQPLDMLHVTHDDKVDAVVIVVASLAAMELTPDFRSVVDAGLAQIKVVHNH